MLIPHVVPTVGCVAEWFDLLASIPSLLCVWISLWTILSFEEAIYIGCTFVPEIIHGLASSTSKAGKSPYILYVLVWHKAQPSVYKYFFGIMDVFFFFAIPLVKILHLEWFGVTYVNVFFILKATSTHVICCKVLQCKHN
jgi:hypothetical protein